MPTQDQIQQSVQQQIAQLEQQLAQAARGQGVGNSGPNAYAGTNRVQQLQARLAPLRAQMAQITRGQQQAQVDDGRKRVEDARNEMYGLARGRIGELSNDPMDRMIADALTARIQGQDQPYNAETRNALIADRAQQAAHAEQQLLGRMASGGGRASDPSYQAMMLEAQAARQGAVQDANLDISQRANLANYDARSGALGQGAAFNAGRQDRQTDAQRYLAGLLMRETATPTTNLPPSIPTFSQFQTGQRIGGGGALSDGERLARGIPLGQATRPGDYQPYGNPYGGRTGGNQTPAVSTPARSTPAASTNDGMGTWDDNSPYGSTPARQTTTDNWNYQTNPWPTAMPPAAEPDYGNYGKMTTGGTKQPATGQRPTYGARGYSVPNNAQDYTPQAEQIMEPSQIAKDPRRTNTRRYF